MPRALYDFCRADDLEPVMATAQVVMQTSRQTRDYLLCKECEGILSKNGENWLLPRLARYKGNFRVYEILQKVPPDVDEEDIIAYSASRNPEIDVNSITHFAAGIFWKASVHSWKKGISKPKIDLGKYSDQLREFVYGVAPFPRETVLRVAVNPPEKAIINFVDPYLGQAADHQNFVFFVPGMQFVLGIKEGMNPEWTDMCFAKNTNHPIVVFDGSEDLKQIYQESTKNAYRPEKLKKLLKFRKPR
jgi:hypothetical protein